MRTNTKRKHVEENKTELKVVQTNPIKTVAYNDINLKNWKDYPEVKTDTFWQFPTRLKEHGHSNDYHGNYIPQLAQQFYERYTKKGDVVLDLLLLLKEIINLTLIALGLENRLWNGCH